MTLLVASIAEADFPEVKRQAETAWASGAQAVELRLDAYSDRIALLADYLKAHQNCTWIVTCRSVEEGGRFAGPGSERISRIVTAAQGSGAYIDLELADWRRCAEARRQIAGLTASGHGRRCRLILSVHDVRGKPDDLPHLADELTSIPDIACAKLAYRAEHVCESFAALDLMHAAMGGEDTSGVLCTAREQWRIGVDSGETGRPGLTAIAMGEDGLWTRILPRKFAGFASYCSLEPESATASGQIPLSDMIHRYRWQAIDGSTCVFGVIGEPVAHSMSPLVFNRWFADAGINAVYVPLRVRSSGGKELDEFLDGCLFRPWLDIGGFSVTTPHKASALRWAGRGGDTIATRIGAANTLVFDPGGRRAHNTDCAAAVSSLAAALGATGSGLAGLSVDLLGTGGAARAVLYGLHEAGCRVCVYGRSVEKAIHLACEHGGTAAAWGARTAGQGDVLVNCTNVGMWPEVNASPMPADGLSRYKLAFDLIYRPLQTRLLSDAAMRGVSTLNGLDMFVRQAAMQFELWTGRRPDVPGAVQAIRRTIREENEPA